MAVEINVKGPIISNSQKWLYDWLKMEACAPKDITDKLNEANGEDIVLNINSNGGVAVAGFEIYTLLKVTRVRLQQELLERLCRRHRLLPVRLTNA